MELYIFTSHYHWLFRSVLHAKPPWARWPHLNHHEVKSGKRLQGNVREWGKTEIVKGGFGERRNEMKSEIWRKKNWASTQGRLGFASHSWHFVAPYIISTQKDSHTRLFGHTCQSSDPHHAPSSHDHKLKFVLSWVVTWTTGTRMQRKKLEARFSFKIQDVTQLSVQHQQGLGPVLAIAGTWRPELVDLIPRLLEKSTIESWLERWESSSHLDT